MYRFFLVLFLVLAAIAVSQAQSKYRTSKGEVRFNASTPLEDIDATNMVANAILDPETGNFAVVMLIRDFSFESKLMQEHFNENYMESNVYPKAYFSGTVKNLEWATLSSDPVEKEVQGKLTIHGVSRDRKEKINLSREGNSIKALINFIVRPEDHDIEVPKIVFQKIAREVQVWVDLSLNIPR